MGNYAKFMFVLGLIVNFANPDNDVVAKIFDKDNLPKRVRYKNNGN